MNYYDDNNIQYYCRRPPQIRKILSHFYKSVALMLFALLLVKFFVQLPYKKYIVTKRGQKRARVRIGQAITQGEGKTKEMLFTRFTGNCVLKICFLPPRPFFAGKYPPKNTFFSHRVQTKSYGGWINPSSPSLPLPSTHIS